MPRVLGTAARREPSHAGSWYDSDASVLSTKIDAWLDGAPQISSDEPGGGHTRAIIGPHAGYSYCGHVMGAAYCQIDPSQVDRVLLLGPSHHFYTRKCALSASAAWGTPLGDLRVDATEMERLLERGRGGEGARGSGPPPSSALSSQPNPLFEVLSRSDDEAEHSLELHASFIRRVIERKRKKKGEDEASSSSSIPPLIPVMVGALSAETEAATAAALLPLARDPRTLVVVSSDFCHWGSRFQFQSLGEELSDESGSDDEVKEAANGGGGGGAGGSKKTKKNSTEKEKETIADAIERLDRRGMRLIEHQDGPGFRRYLSKTRNTICGRFPISLFLEVLRQLKEEEEGAGGGGGGLNHTVKFVAYDQSQRVVCRSESSVSYAAALVRVVGSK